MPSQPPRLCVRCRRLHLPSKPCDFNSMSNSEAAILKDDGRLSARPWNRLRTQVIMLQNEECARNGCDELIEEVDHIIPRKARPDLKYKLSNLEGLCKKHHAEKTLTEKGG